MGVGGRGRCGRNEVPNVVARINNSIEFEQQFVFRVAWALEVGVGAAGKQVTTSWWTEHAKLTNSKSHGPHVFFFVCLLFFLFSFHSPYSFLASSSTSCSYLLLAFVHHLGFGSSRNARSVHHASMLCNILF